MTKASPILITKRASLAGMPEPQRATVRHVLLDAVGGLDSTHDSRWRRFVNRLLRAEPGEVFELLNLVERSASSTGATWRSSSACSTTRSAG